MLHWNAEDCKDWNTLSEDFQRIVVEAAFHGPAVYNRKAPHKCLLTDRDKMIKCIGLRTNASEIKNTAKWFKQLHDGVVMTRQWRKRSAQYIMTAADPEAS